MKTLESADVTKWFESGPLSDLDVIDRVRIESRMLDALDSLDVPDRELTLWELYELSYSSSRQEVEHETCNENARV
jgi:hypothetical protein